MQTITRRADYLWSQKQNKYLLVRKLSSISWTDQIAQMKGASSQQTQLADSQQQFYNTLSQDYSKQFASQNAILGTLQNTLNPIIQAGPNQFGFNAAETNNLNSQAIQGTGQQYNNAKKALASQQAAAGGGNTLLPSGVQSQQQAGLASSAANQASNQLLGIQQAGYEQGHNQYENAIGQLGGVASQYNPTGYAGSANNAGSSAFNSATEVQKLNAAASPWNMVGNILGGAASIGLGALTGGLGTAAGGALGGLFGGGGSSNSSADFAEPINYDPNLPTTVG